MTKQRTFENPIFGDKVTYLKTSEETYGAFGLAALELLPGGSTPLHYHNSFSETFTVQEGALTVQVGKQQKLLLEGDSFTVTPGTLHRFMNKRDTVANFTIQVVPGHTGFENAIRIAYGLARDGRTNKKGLPKNLAHMAILVNMGDGNFPGWLSFLTPPVKLVARWAKRKGIEARLLDQYC